MAPLYTIGHSTRSLDELVALLRAHDVEILADVRTIPRSRRYPHFAGEALARTLPAQGVRYVHLPRLGGLRRGLGVASPNRGWKNASFRAYADYMLGEDFSRGLDELLALRDEGTVAILCAEAVFWRCHRSLLADALAARGIEVRHIVSATRMQPHVLTPFARVEGTRVTYPPATHCQNPSPTRRRASKQLRPPRSKSRQVRGRSS